MESLGAEKLLIRHTSKAQDTGSKNWGKGQTVPDRKNYTSNRKRKSSYYLYRKKPRIMREIEKTCKICRRVYQSLFIDIADFFIEYIESLDLDEIQQMDDDIKSNGWG